MMNAGYDLTMRWGGTFQGRERTKEAEMDGAITIRLSTQADQEQIVRLAALDSSRPPFGEVALAFVDGELRAAVALESGHAVADPFHPTAEVVELLRMSARQPDRATGFGLRAFRQAPEAA
jgi:hypothetical protein